MPSAAFESLVDNLIDKRTETEMRGVVNAAQTTVLDPEAIAYLAQALARSGEVLPTRTPPTRSADIASTGGPSSLSTLLCPLYLRAMGCVVPKLGVPGRPAGGVDVLAQLPRYELNQTGLGVERILDECGYAHFIANQYFAPLDDSLFRFRQRIGAQSVPALAIASLLAKKVAVGLTAAGLDVRVGPHGNLGRTWDEARTNAQLFCQAAAALGITAVCFLSDATQPYQPFIGRGESLLAMAEVFDGLCTGSLKKHADQCFAMAVSVAQPSDSRRPTGQQLRDCFLSNVVAQGAASDALDQAIRSVRSSATLPIRASREGFLVVDLGLLRDTLVDWQRRVATESLRFPDPCGVVLKLMPTEYASLGQELAEVRVAAHLKGEATRVRDEVARAFTETAVAPATRTFEEYRLA